jgi:hypothetical protein
MYSTENITHYLYSIALGLSLRTDQLLAVVADQVGHSKQVHFNTSCLTSGQKLKLHHLKMASAGDGDTQLARILSFSGRSDWLHVLSILPCIQPQISDCRMAGLTTAG